MNSEIGRMAFKEPSHSTWISDDTISYWAGFGRQVCKCLEQALQIGSGVAGTASTLSLHVVSATRRLATDVLLPLCPLALNYGVNHLVEKSLEKPAVGQIALGGSCMVTGAFVFHLGVKKLQYAALLDRDPQMLSLRNRKSIKTIRKTDSFSDVSLEPVLAFEKRKKFHAAMLCMIGGAGSFIFGLANVVGGVYSLMEERMRLYEASQQRELTDRLIGHLNNCKSTRALLKKAGTDIKFDWTSNESSYNPNTHTICIRENLPLDQEFKEATLNLATAVNKQGIAHMQKQLLEGSLSREDYCFQRYKLYHTSLMTQSNAVHQCKEWLSSAISIEGYEKVEKTYVEMAQTMIKSKVKRTDNSALSTMDEAMQFIWNQVIDANWEENRDKEMAEKYENEWDRLYKAKYCQSNPSSHLC